MISPLIDKVRYQRETIVFGEMHEACRNDDKVLDDLIHLCQCAHINMQNALDDDERKEASYMAESIRGMVKQYEAYQRLPDNKWELYLNEPLERRDTLAKFLQDVEAEGEYNKTTGDSIRNIRETFYIPDSKVQKLGHRALVEEKRQTPPLPTYFGG